MDTTTATPAQIDTALKALMEAEAIAETRRDRAAKAAQDTWISEARRDALAAEAAMEDANVEAAKAAQAPLNAEFARRHGWTRAYLAVTNGRGHVHSSTACSTCHNGRQATRLHWMTTFSGLTQDEIIDAAGERACTVCYPDAPAEKLAQPTRMFSQDEIDAQAAREARQAERTAKAAKAATKAITNPDGTPLRDQDRLPIKTEVTAWNTLVSLMTYSRIGYRAHLDVQDRIVAALAAKLGQDEAEVRATATKKADAKARREGF